MTPKEVLTVGLGRPNLHPAVEHYGTQPPGAHDERHLHQRRVCHYMAGNGDERTNCRWYSRPLYEVAQEWVETSDPKAFAVIFHASYFTGVWIVQEFLLARRVRMLLSNLWLNGGERQAKLAEWIPKYAFELLFTRAASANNSSYVPLYDLDEFLLYYSDNKCEIHRTWSMVCWALLDQKSGYKLTTQRFRSRC